MSVIIRLDNLSWNASSLDVRRYFYGLEIPDGGVHIVGGERGTVFVAFATDEDARQAMLKDNGRICNGPVKLLLSSRTEMQNTIASARGGSGPIHEVFMGPSFGKHVDGPVVQSDGQQRFKNFSEPEERDRGDNCQRFSPLRPGGLSANMLPYPETSSERQRLGRSGTYDENRFLKEPRNTISQGSGRHPFDDTKSRNEGARDQWNSKDRKESEAGFRKPDSERFGDWLKIGGPEEREVEVRQGSFNYRREPINRDGSRQAELDFERNRSCNVGDESRFPPSKEEFFGNSRSRAQDRGPLDQNYFKHARPLKGYDLPEKYPQDTDRNPLGSEDLGHFFEHRDGERRYEQQRGDWFVRVYNLPQTFNYREVRRFFSKSIIPQDGLKLINGRHGHRTGECYVRLANEMGFWAALDCNGTLLSGKTVIVERTTAEEFDDAWDSYVPPGNRSRSRSPREGNAKEKLYYVAVKNLPYNCIEDDLIKWLGNPPFSSDSGPYFGYDGSGNKIGKAFLRLNSFKDFKAMLSCNKKDWQGKQVRVTAIGERIFHDRRAIARKWNAFGNREKTSGTDQSLREDSAGPRIPATAKDEKKFYCVRISGLPFTSNPQAVKEFFKGLEIATGGIHIVYNQDNQAAGLGFVDFVTSTDCRRALERNNQYMGKRYLVLEPVTKDDFLSEFQALQRKHGRIGDGSGDSRSRSCDRNAVASETVVRMKNLHFKVQLEDVLRFFRGHHPIMESMKLQYRDGRPTGDGLISFASFAEAERAVNELNHQKLLGWPLTMMLM